VHIKVKVIPESVNEKAVMINPQKYEIYLNARTQGGAANKRLSQIILKLLELDERLNTVKIIKGGRSRNKIIEIFKKNEN
jgi:uncharacterized protein YggU (UPF0235/DUF167 family)